MTVLPRKFFQLKNKGCVPGKPEYDRVRFQGRNIVKARFLRCNSDLEVLGGNPMFFHEIIEIGPVFSG